jgi:FKBP-type peptidyl-prolyl cis-trans isomerase
MSTDDPKLMKRPSQGSANDAPISVTNDGMVTKRIVVEGSADFKDSAGNGPCPPAGSTVEVHYTGRLDNLQVFDSSRGRNKTFKFVLGARNVILGWDKAVATMRRGERAEVRIAPDYAYGSSAVGGVIPANSTLTFDIELLGWQEPGRSFADKLKNNELMVSLLLIGIALSVASYFW